MTVMFCDLVGSTSLAERVDPEDLRDLLSEYHKVSVSAIERYAGHVAKYMGDGMVVYFGYPHAHEDDPRRAVHAGLELLAQLRALNDRLARQYEVELHARVGIHTGLVVAGEMGWGQTREELAITGETPNIAARIESTAETDTVAISEATFRLVDGYFTARPRGNIPLKGVSRPLEVFQVEGATRAVDRLDAVARGPLTPLVGRRDEIARLLAGWASVATGRGVIAHVSGQAGIGKSRVARALTDELAGVRRRGLLWQCSAYHENSVLYPVTSYLVRWLRLEDAAPDEQLRALDAAATEAGLDAAESLPLVADLLGTPGSAAPGRAALSPLDARSAILHVLDSLLIANPAHHPLLLVVEDLQWADATTLEFLTRVIDRLETLPIMIVATYRPEFHPPWRLPDVAVELKPLSAADVAAMIGAVGEGSPISGELAGRVAAAADGVPLFVEEMLRMLATASEGDGAGAANREPAVPPTLRGLLTARLDRLGAEKEVAQVAAVLGREFREDLLSALLPHEPAAVAAALEQLVRADVLGRSATPGPRRYEFTHSLLQEAAYSGLLRRRRIETHAAVAEALVSRFPRRAEREPETVAHHLALAGDHRRAAGFWRAAGLQALANAAFREAAGHFEQGLRSVETWDPSPERDAHLIEFLTHLAASRQAGIGYAAAGIDALYERARQLCEHTGDGDALLLVLRGQWLFHLLRADYATAWEIGQRVLKMAEERGDGQLLVEGHTYLGMVASFRGELAVSRRHFESAIEVYTPVHRPEQLYATLGESIVMAHAYLAPVLWLQGHVDDSQARSDQSLELSEALTSVMTRAQAWGMRALHHLARKEVGAGSQWTEKVMAYCEERRIPYWQHLSSIVDGWFHGRTVDAETGLDRVQRSIDSYLSTGSRLGMLTFMIMLADLHRAAGNVAAGLEAISRAEQHAAETGERSYLDGVLRVKGELLLAQDPPDRAGAAAAFVAAVEIARQQGARISELRATAMVLKVRGPGGDDGTWRARLAELCAWFPAACDVADLRDARALLAKLEADAGGSA